MGTPNLLGFNETLIVFAGEHAEVLQKAGWSRLDVQRFLMEHTRRRWPTTSAARGCRARSTPADETTWRYVFERPEDILIAFAGGRAGSWSACLPGLGDQVDPQRHHPHRVIPRRYDMKLFDPTSTPVERAVKLAPRPASPRGLRLGLVENTKFNCEHASWRSWPSGWPSATR